MQTSLPVTIHEELVELVTSRGFRAAISRTTAIRGMPQSGHQSRASFARGLVQLFAFSEPRVEWGVTWRDGPMRFYPYEEKEKAMEEVVSRLRTVRDEVRHALGEWTLP